MNKDLTIGAPQKVLWQFCLPLLGSILFQQLYNLADSFVAGKFIGENALAAVGNSYEITLIYLAFAFGCNIGCSVLVSQFFGSGNYNRMKSSISTAMITSGVICIVLLVSGILFSGKMLELIHTPEIIMADSKIYLLVYTAGLPFVFFYNIATGIFSALGDSKTPFYFLAASSTGNIAADILFVTVFHMGVSGVAWATFLCQGISCILVLIFLKHRIASMKITGKSPLFSAELFRKYLSIAIPSILQQSFISIGNIIIQSVINGFGPGVIAGYAAGVKLNNLVITCFTTVGNGISNFTAQNLGAHKTERIRDGFRAGIRMVWILCIPVFFLYFFGGRIMLKLFMDEPTADALSTGLIYLRILSPFYFVVSAKLIADGILRGSEKMTNFMISTFTDLILRVVLSIVLSGTVLGSVGIWCSWPFGWTAGAALSLLFYYRYRKFALE